MSYDLQSHTFRCAATGRRLEEGEVYYAVVRFEDGKLLRLDYSEDAWQGPPHDAFGSWKARVPGVQKKPAQADPDLLLEIFDQLHRNVQPASEALRYLLALMLVRRKVARLVEVQSDDAGQVWVLHCSRNGNRYQVRDPGLGPAELSAQQEELTRLLDGGV